ncbi:MAG: hypothetical protein EOP04_22935 [Proteobacteria bacterium]|nr:MAG: hypothetical protein EOP04_22935 [Pseudomonadota bacterium]
MFEPINTDEFISLAEFSRLTGKYDRAIRRAIESGKIVSYRRRGKLYELHKTLAAKELGVLLNEKIQPQVKAHPINEMRADPEPLTLSPFLSFEERPKANAPSQGVSELDLETHQLKLRQHRAKTIEMEIKTERSRGALIERATELRFLEQYFELQKSILIDFATNAGFSTGLGPQGDAILKERYKADIEKLLGRLRNELEKKKMRLQTNPGSNESPFNH